MNTNVNKKNELVCMYCKKQYIHDNPAIRGKGAAMYHLKTDPTQMFHLSCYNYNTHYNKGKDFDFCANCGKGIKAGNVVYINQVPFGSTCAKNIQRETALDLIYNKVFHKKVITPFHLFFMRQLKSDSEIVNLKNAYHEQMSVYEKIYEDKANFKKYFNEAKKDFCKIKYLSENDASLDLLEDAR